MILREVSGTRTRGVWYENLEDIKRRTSATMRIWHDRSKRDKRAAVTKMVKKCQKRVAASLRAQNYHRDRTPSYDIVRYRAISQLIAIDRNCPNFHRTISQLIAINRN